MLTQRQKLLLRAQVMPARKGTGSYLRIKLGGTSLLFDSDLPRQAEEKYRPALGAAWLRAFIKSGSWGDSLVIEAIVPQTPEEIRAEVAAAQAAIAANPVKARFAWVRCEENPKQARTLKAGEPLPERFGLGVTVRGNPKAQPRRERGDRDFMILVTTKRGPARVEWGTLSHYPETACFLLSKVEWEAVIRKPLVFFNEDEDGS